MNGRMAHIFLGVAAAFILCFSSSQIQAGTPKNQLVIGINMLTMLTLDPQNSTDPGTHLYVTNCYDYLIMTDDDDPNILHPGLAETWEERDNGTLVFNIRKGVKFHSGNPLTADDVVFSLRRCVKAGNTATSYFSQWGYKPDNVDEKIFKVDEYTVQMDPVILVTPKLKLLLLARQLGGILDSKLVLKNEKNGDQGKAWLAANEAGSGPFVLSRWNSNDILIMTRFDDYWGDKAKMNRVMMRHLPESQVVRLQLEKGDLDLGFNLIPADLDALTASPDVDVMTVPYPGFYYICMSTKDPDLAKADVRRAIRYAIDFEGINSTVLRYAAIPVRSFIPEGVAGYNPDIGNEYNPEKAKELLAKAGYQPGQLKKQFLTVSASPNADMAAIIQANLAAVGIQIDILAGNGEQAYGPLRNRDYHFGSGTTGLTGPGDPDAWVRYNMYNPDNSDESRLTNLQAWRQSVSIPEINALIDEAGSIRDEARRAELYAQAVKIYEDFGPAFIPIGRRIDSTAVHKTVKNFKPNHTGTTRLNQVEK